MNCYIEQQEPCVCLGIFTETVILTMIKATYNMASVCLMHCSLHCNSAPLRFIFMSKQLQYLIIILL